MTMRSRSVSALAVAAAAVVTLLAVPAAAASSPFHHCGTVQRADGSTSLEDVAAAGGYPLSGIIAVQQECGPNGQFTPWMAAYLNLGDQSLAMPAGTRYWPGTGNINI